MISITSQNTVEQIRTLGAEPIFHFPEGIPAFEWAKNFVLIINPEIDPFLILANMEMDNFGFFCIDPFLILPEYHFQLSTQDQSFLQIQSIEDILVLAFVSRAPNPEDFTANLLAPVVINIRNRLAKQIILDNWPVRFRIWEAVERFSSTSSIDPQSSSSLESEEKGG